MLVPSWVSFGPESFQVALLAAGVEAWPVLPWVLLAAAAALGILGWCLVARRFARMDTPGPLENPWRRF